MLLSKRNLTLCLLSAFIAGCCCKQQPLSSCQITSKQGRVEYLQALQQWQIAGKIALNNAENNVNASFTWQQDEDRYRVHFCSPFSNETVTVTGNAEKNSVLSNNGENVAELQLEQQLPFAQMGWWLKGLPAPQSTPQIALYDKWQRLQRLEQDGWSVEYQGYGGAAPVALPRKVIVTDGVTKAKVVVKNWQY